MQICAPRDWVSQSLKIREVTPKFEMGQLRASLNEWSNLEANADPREFFTDREDSALV